MAISMEKASFHWQRQFPTSGFEAEKGLDFWKEIEYSNTNRNNGIMGWWNDRLDI